MTGQQLSEDRKYAAAIEEELVDLLAGREIPNLPVIIEGETGAEVNVVETYTEAGVLGRDRGLVLHMSDGAQVRLTIQAYTPRSER